MTYDNYNSISSYTCDYNAVAKVEEDGSLVCKACQLKYCVLVKKNKSTFCKEYRGSVYNGKLEYFKVKCNG